MLQETTEGSPKEGGGIVSCGLLTVSSPSLRNVELFGDFGDDTASVQTLIPPRRLVISLANSLADISPADDAIDSFLMDSVGRSCLLSGKRGHSPRLS